MIRSTDAQRAEHVGVSRAGHPTLLRAPLLLGLLFPMPDAWAGPGDALVVELMYRYGDPPDHGGPSLIGAAHSCYSFYQPSVSALATNAERLGVTYTFEPTGELGGSALLVLNDWLGFEAKYARLTVGDEVVTETYSFGRVDPEASDEAYLPTKDLPFGYMVGVLFKVAPKLRLSTTYHSWLYGGLVEGTDGGDATFASRFHLARIRLSPVVGDELGAGYTELNLVSYSLPGAPGEEGGMLLENAQLSSTVDLFARYRIPIRSNSNINGRQSSRTRYLPAAFYGRVGAAVGATRVTGPVEDWGGSIGMEAGMGHLLGGDRFNLGFYAGTRAFTSLGLQVDLEAFINVRL